MISTPSSKTQFFWSCIIIVFASIIYLIGVNNYIKIYFDDAYMFIRYAKNFIAGHGMAWNAGEEIVYGNTSLLQFFYITFLRWILPFSDGTVLAIASGTMGYLSIALIVYTCIKFSTSDLLKKQYLHYFIGLLVFSLMTRNYIYIASTGMETMTGIFTNIALIYFTLQFVKQQKWFTFAFVVLLSYLTTLARPDSIFYACLFPSITFLTQFNSKDRIKYFLIFGTLFTILFFTDLGVKYYFFNDIFPLSFYVKKYSFFDGFLDYPIWSPIKFMFDYFILALPFFLLGILMFSRRCSIIWGFLIPFTITMAYFLTVNQLMGLWSRFYLPSLPFLAVGAVLSLNHFLEQKALDYKTYFLSFFRVAAFLLFFFCIATADILIIKYELFFMPKVTVYESDVKYETTSTEKLPKLAWDTIMNNITVLAQKAPKGLKIATTDHGYFGAAATHINIIDMAGLHDKHTAYNGFSDTYLMDKKPDIIFPFTSYTLMNKQLFENEDFITNYDFYPSAFWYGLAIRKDSPHLEKIRPLIQKTWQRLYPNHPMNLYKGIPEKTEE